MMIVSAGLARRGKENMRLDTIATPEVSLCEPVSVESQVPAIL